MTGSLLKLLSSLKEAKTAKEKKQASLTVLKYIEKSREYSEKLLENYLTQTLKIRSEYFRDIVESELFKTRLKAYSDLNGNLKIAYGVSFVQDDFKDPILELDEKISHLILGIVSENNLEDIVNDISINSYQFVDMNPVEAYS